MWRLIDSGLCDASYNMALDEAIAVSVRKGLCPPTLRFYGWSIASLSIGCFQKTNDIDIEYCMSKGIPIVRRPTGGRAILHDRELTYSFSSRLEGHFQEGLHQSYKKISTALIIAFKRLGIQSEFAKTKRGSYSRSPLCFQSRSYGELSCSGRKLAGSAQKRWYDGFLQQGSIPFSINLKELKSIFISEQLIEDKSLANEEIPFHAFSIKPLKSAIKEAFQKVFEIEFMLSKPTPYEAELTQDLLIKKYLQAKWNLQR